MDYRLFWSDESIENFKVILDDIKLKWTEKEVEIFKINLSRQLYLILQNPYLFPASHYNPRLRKAVLSKQTTIFYEIRNDFIYVAYLHLNKKDINGIQ